MLCKKYVITSQIFSLSVPCFDKGEWHFQLHLTCFLLFLFLLYWVWQCYRRNASWIISGLNLTEKWGSWVISSSTHSVIFSMYPKLFDKIRISPNMLEYFATASFGKSVLWAAGVTLSQENPSRWNFAETTAKKTVMANKHCWVQANRAEKSAKTKLKIALKNKLNIQGDE